MRITWRQKKKSWLVSNNDNLIELKGPKGGLRIPLMGASHNWMSCCSIPLHRLGKGLPVPSLKRLKPDALPNLLPLSRQQDLPAHPGISYPGGLNTFRKASRAIRYVSCKAATEQVAGREEGQWHRSQPSLLYQTGAGNSLSEPQHAFSQKGWLWGLKLGHKCKLRFN